jgi:hypothetical protein
MRCDRRNYALWDRGQQPLTLLWPTTTPQRSWRPAVRGDGPIPEFPAVLRGGALGCASKRPLLKTTGKPSSHHQS